MRGIPGVSLWSRNLQRRCVESHRERGRGIRADSTGRAGPGNNRRSRSTSGTPWPAASVATTRTAAVPSAFTTREQAQVSARPSPTPKPRKRSSRDGPADGRVAARRTICAPTALSKSKRRGVAPKIACRPRSPTESANRRNSRARLATGSSPPRPTGPQVAGRSAGRALTPQSACDGNSCLEQILVVPAARAVHATTPTLLP
jgi:hypothetical protein